jgi:N-acyl-D-amino-acid deacylase
VFYPTNSGAPTDEVVALAEVASRAGGMYVTHMRNEHDGVAESLDETFEIGQRADMPVVISHHKCAGARNFGRTRETLAKIDAARTEQDIGLDVYPYAAGSTALMSEMLDGEAKVLITWSTAKPEMAGRYLSEIAAELGISEMEAADRLQPAGAVYFMMDEHDVQRILSYPHSMIGSDGIPHDERPHPRLWGTFPRVLGHYARELGLFSLEEAVRKMTGLSATRFGLVDRGEVRAGAFADLVIFDAATVADRATYADPIQPAAGIDRVIVNGLVIWENGAASGERPGRILKRAA